jgi:hypothetical protein
MKRRLALGLFALALTSATQGQPPHDAIKLNVGADWNQFAPEEVQEFEGVLLVEEDPETVSFVMRFNPYKLKLSAPADKTLDVYGRDPKLKPFVGRQVTISGKRVQDEIEGVFFDEIWPVTIRALD